MSLYEVFKFIELMGQSFTADAMYDTVALSKPRTSCKLRVTWHNTTLRSG